MIKKVRARIVEIMDDEELTTTELADLCGKDRQTIEKAICPKKNSRHSDVFIAELCHGVGMKLPEFFNFEIPLCARPEKKKK